MMKNRIGLVYRKKKINQVMVGRRWNWLDYMVRFNSSHVQSKVSL